MSDINTYFQVHAQEFEKDLCTLLSIPSVSTDAERKPDMQACAQEVVRQLLQAGMEEARIMPTGGHPAVFAASKHREGLPTVLVYGHYDVQPETPLELWETPPFQPTVRDGRIYARGTTDDKGQFLIHLKAAQGLNAVHGQLPVNLKFILEGEEEIGSPNLPAFIEEHKELLACDVLVISDTGMYAPGIPSLLYGLRGLSYLEVEVKGADGDLHSGIFGGAVPNPALELCRILTALKDTDGRILIPGFYDKVRDLSPAERAEWAALPFDDEEFRSSVGCKGLSGEEGFTTLERRWARPTLDVNGMLSGFTGEGVKTVLPGRAMAKVSCRLVPDQDPEEIARLVEQEVLRLAPDTVEVKVRYHHGGSPWMTDPTHPVLEAAGRAAEKAWGRTPVRVREGGSIPIVSTFCRILEVPAVLLGIGLADENAHAPNEHLDLGNFHAGIRASAFLMEELAAQTAAR